MNVLITLNPVNASAINKFHKIICIELNRFDTETKKNLYNKNITNIHLGCLAEGFFYLSKQQILPRLNKEIRD